MSQAEALQEEIHSLEEQLQDRSRLLAEKKQETGLATVDVAEAEKEASEAENELAAAQEEFRAAEQERNALLPQYERCQQNKDQYVKGLEYKKQITQAEQSLKEAEQSIKSLEVKLQEVSAAYKTERERKALLVGRVVAQLDDLRAVVEEKVMLTVPIDEQSGGPDVAFCYRSVSELNRRREISIAQCARHARELDAAINLKQQRAIEVRAESDREIAALKRQKDEQVKNAVLKFEEERAAIQSDVDRVRAANAEMQRELHQTKVVSDTRGTGAGAVGGADASAPRRQATAQLDSLTKRGQDLQVEKQALLKQLQATANEQQRLQGSLQQLQKQADAEAGKHKTALRGLEAQVHRDRTTAGALEKENVKLEEMCDVLAAAIQAHGAR